MEKFLSWTDGDGKTLLFPINNIIGIRGGSIRNIFIYYNKVAYKGLSRNSEVLCWRLTAANAITTEAVNAQLNSVADAIEDLLSSKHKDRILSLNNKFTYPLSTVSETEIKWGDNNP